MGVGICIFKILLGGKTQRFYGDYALEENICIRVVSSVDKIVKLFPHVAARTIYPAELTYRSKAILMFQRGEDDIDVCLFAMYVQEYGMDSPDPNQRRVYISYLDSVKYFEPPRLRTKVYHQASARFVSASIEVAFRSA